MAEERNKRLTVLLTETEMVDLERERSKIGLSKSAFMLLMYKYGLYATEQNRNNLQIAVKLGANNDEQSG